MSTVPLYQAQVRIGKALEKLLEKKPLSKITVVELMRQLNMSRQTFYRNFLDVDEVVYWLYKEHAKKAVEEFYKTKDYRKTIASTAVFMKEHANFYHNVINMDGPNAFKNQFFNAMVEYTRGYIGHSNIDDKMDYAIRLYWYGATFSLLEWVRNGMTIPPDLLAEYFYTGMPQIIRQFYPAS